MPYGPAARLGDLTSHGSPLVPGIGSVNVLIESKPAWRALMDFHACPIVKGLIPDVGGMVLMGSPTVLINSMMACRVMDMVVEIPGGPNPIAMGAAKVFIGDMATPQPGMGMPDAMAAVGGAATPRSSLSSAVAAAQAKTLIDAAKAGAPFCEKCQKAQSAQSATAAKGSGSKGSGSKGSTQDANNGSSKGETAQSQAKDGPTDAVGQGAGVEQATTPASAPAGERKTWVEIKLVNKDGAPVPGKRYRVTPPNGAPIEGTLDATGIARIDGVDFGLCKVSLLDLDGKEWGPLGGS